MHKIIITTLLPLVALAGCATHYGKETSFHNGYSDYRVAEDRFVVTFRANEFTPSHKVMKYALKRASELTLKEGYRYFSVVEQNENGKNLHYPSIRILIQCYNDRPAERESIDAATFLSMGQGR